MSCNTYNPCKSNNLSQVSSYAATAGQYAQQAQQSATNAATSATQASTAEAQAEQYAIQAAASAAISGIYLGAKSTAPVVDNQGNPLQEGMQYFNSVNNTMYVWDGTSWITATGFNETTNFLATGTTTPRNLVTRMADVVNVKDFGAVGDGVADDTAAIQAAIDSLDPLLGGTVYLPSGNYIVSNTLNATPRGIAIEGNGPDATIIRANHSTGAVVRFYRRFSGLRKIGILSTGSRASAINQTGFGVQFESEDVPDSITIRMQSCFCDSVSIQSQPGTGFYFVGPATQGSMLQNCFSNANRGHGFAYDRGILSNRVNITGPSGCMTLDTCLFYSNYGNGIACGSPIDAFSTPSLRMVVENCELSANATDASVRYVDSQIYMKGTNNEVRASVMASSTGTSTGIWCAGRNIWIRDNRFLELPHAVEVGVYPELSTNGVNIEGMTIINSTIPSMNPAVIVNSGAENVRITQRLIGNFTTLVTPNVPGYENCTIPQIISKTTDTILNNQGVLQNDADLKFYMAANEKITFQCVIEHLSVVDTTDIRLAFTTPIGSAIRWGPTNSIKIDASDNIVIQEQISASGTSVEFGSSISRRQILIEGAVNNGANAGFLQLQYCQATPSANNLTIYATYSNIKIWREY